MRMLLLQHHRRTTTSLLRLATATTATSTMTTSRCAAAMAANAAATFQSARAATTAAAAVTTQQSKFLSSKPLRPLDTAAEDRCCVFASSCSSSRCRRSFSSSEKPVGDSYHVEVSNLYGSFGGGDNYTQIVVTGNGVPGLLASICAAITVKGGSIKVLHAADDMKEGGGSGRISGGKENNSELIKDVIYVVERSTGKAFKDEDLEGLGYAVLRSTANPMAAVQAMQGALGGEGGGTPLEKKGNVTVLQANKFPAL